MSGVRRRKGAFDPAHKIKRRVTSRARAIAIAASLLAGFSIAPSVAQPAGLNAASVMPRVKPPAPEPKYASRNDLARLDVLRKDLAAKRFAEARRTIETMENPIAKSLALWYYFDAKDPLVRADDAKAFLDAHPDWPSLSRIQAHAEERMPTTLPAKDVIAFFEGRDPQSIEGKMSLARAFLGTGDEDAASSIVSDAWRNDRFTLAQERDFLKRFGRLLTVEDHEARVDDLLFRRQVTNARRVFGYLPPKARGRANARALLLLQAKGARTAYERLSAEDRGRAGVVHAAMRHYRRAGDEPRAMSIARAYKPDTPGEKGSASIWFERQLLMRYALNERLYADAYAMAAGHGLAPGGTGFSEAEFNAGWIALRFLDDPERARLHFAALTASVTAPISLARGYYWLGRTDDAEGDADAAAIWYAKAADHPYTYYGQLAAERIGGKALERGFEAAPTPTPEERARFASRPAAQALRILSEVGDQRAFLIFGYYLDDVLESPGEFLELADAASRLPAPHVTVRAGKAGVRRGVFAPQVSYPTIFVPEEASQFVEPAVILGLSRQESEFNPRAYSRAGARGIMQLMPATAKITANKERVVYRRSALLEDPNYNMLIGSAHLSHLIADLGGSLPMVFAGYNAGKGRVSQWIERYGDPRTGAIDPIDWIELIPFSETRNYVQRVLENTQVYRSVLNGAPLAGGLSADIESGGPSGSAGAKPAIRAAGLLPAAPARTIEIAELFFAAAEASDPDNPFETSTGAPEDTAADAPAQVENAAQSPAVGPAAAPSIEAANAPPRTVPAPDADQPATGDQALETPPARAAATQPAPSTAASSAVASDPIKEIASQITAAPSRPSVTDASLETDVAPQPTLEHLASPDRIETSDAQVNANALRIAAPVSETPAVQPSRSSANPSCLGYVAFIAAQAEEATPQDLNAGVLAELTSGAVNEACADAAAAVEPDAADPATEAPQTRADGPERD
ncbi:MAG: transglycosylase SLT domain-containing protein [Pseudomonadota bacterium]